MKKNLLYAVAILFGINGLHAFNPFTAMRNVVSGEGGCQPSLVDQIAKGLPAFQASRNKILSGQALKNKQAIEKDMGLLKKCTGDDPNRDQQVLLGEKLRSNHPKLTEKLTSVCTQNQQFRKMLPNQCAIAGQAKAGIDRRKGIQTNPTVAAGGSQRQKGQRSGKGSRRGGSRNQNSGGYPQQMMPGMMPQAPYGPPPAYGASPYDYPQYPQQMPAMPGMMPQYPQQMMPGMMPPPPPYGY